MAHKPKDPLWEDLLKFRIGGEDDDLSFTARLARENGWREPFAERVFQEYLKFIYLSMRSDRPVTPSDEIDQAWHLHLTYSRSYWDELCGRVLGGPLHHDPTKGGEAEGKKYREQYVQTLERYREVFGEPPPDIWPPVEERFSERNWFVRLNRGRVWVVKPRVAKAALALAGIGVLLLAFDSQISPYAERWGFHLDGILLALAVCVPILLFMSTGGRFGNGSGGGAGCSGGACGGGCGGCGGG